jgi:hypothetical protein
VHALKKKRKKKKEENSNKRHEIIQEFPEKKNRISFPFYQLYFQSVFDQMMLEFPVQSFSLI